MELSSEEVTVGFMVEGGLGTVSREQLSLVEDRVEENPRTSRGQEKVKGKERENEVACSFSRPTNIQPRA